MTDVLNFWFDFFGKIFTKLSECTYDIYGFNISVIKNTF